MNDKIEFEVYDSTFDAAAAQAGQILNRFLGIGPGEPPTSWQVSMFCSPGAGTNDGSISLWRCEVVAVRSRVASS